MSESIKFKAGEDVPDDLWLPVPHHPSPKFGRMVFLEDMEMSEQGGVIVMRVAGENHRGLIRYVDGAGVTIHGRRFVRFETAREHLAVWPLSMTGLARTLEADELAQSIINAISPPRHVASANSKTGGKRWAKRWLRRMWRKPMTKISIAAALVLAVFSGSAHAGPAIPICEAQYDHVPATLVIIVDKSYWDVRADWARSTGRPADFNEKKLENGGVMMTVYPDNSAMIEVSRAGQDGISQKTHDLMIRHKECMLNRKLAGFADWQREDGGAGFHFEDDGEGSGISFLRLFD